MIPILLLSVCSLHPSIRFSSSTANIFDLWIDTNSAIFSTSKTGYRISLTVDGLSTTSINQSNIMLHTDFYQLGTTAIQTVFTLTSSSTIDRIVSLTVHSELQLGSGNSPTITKLDGDRGFRAISDYCHFFLFAKHSPFTTDVDSYTIGSNFAFSWLKKRLIAGSTLKFSVVFSSNSTVLTANPISPTIAGRPLLLSGTAFSGTGSSLSLSVAVDSSSSIVLVPILTSSTFSIEFAHSLPPGEHTLNFIATDAQGSSTVVSLHAALLADTATKTYPRITTIRPIPSSHIVATPTAPPPTVLPSVIELNEEYTTVTPSRTDPVTITGHGRLVGRLSEPFNFTDVTITTDAEVSADDLTVLRRLHIIGSGILMGVSADWVSIATGAEVFLTAQSLKFPHVSLGDVGRFYATEPLRIVVEVDEHEFTSAELSETHVRLISGRTISNCEHWISVASIVPPSSRLKFVCEPSENQTVDESGMRSIVLVGLPPWADQKNTSWVLIVVAVGAVVVVGVIVVIICVCRKRPQKTENPVGSLDTSTYTDT